MNDDYYAPKWPWREMNALADKLYTELTEATAQLMRDAGEDPDNRELFLLRCAQVAYTVGGLAQRARDHA